MQRERLDSAAWLILRDAEQAKDAVQNALVEGEYGLVDVQRIAP
jgi:hypothetical protein